MAKPEVIDGIAVHKSLIIKAGDTSIDANNIKGAAAAMGNLDRGDDVLFPGCGCFAEAIPGFLASGFVAVGHDWKDLPVAFPTIAEERGGSLYTEATFHSTSRAQDARTIAVERKAAGLSVGLSIGFRLASSGYNWFENGEELLSFAKDTLRLDMTLFDVDAITACNDYCRGIWKVKELYEYSLVTVPMNPGAVASDAKAAGGSERDFERFLQEAGYSRKQAQTIIASGYRALLRDSDGQGAGAKTSPESLSEAQVTEAHAAEARFAELSFRISGVR